MFHIQHPAKAPSFLQGLLGSAVEAAPKALMDYTEQRVAQAREQARREEAMRKLGIEEAKVGIADKKAQEAEHRGIKYGEYTDERIRDLKSRQAERDWVSQLGIGGAPAPEQEDQEPAGRPLPSWYESLSEPEKIRLARSNPALANLGEKQREFDQKQAIAKEERDLSKMQFDSKAVRDSYKQNQDYIDKIYTANEGAEVQEAEFDRMEQLIDTGELTNSTVASLFQMFHLPIELLANPTNDEYNKAAYNMTKNVVADYGNRPLLAEFNVMLRRIPSLLNTDEGKRQIISDMRILMEPAKLKAKALRRIIDESEEKNKPLPNDLRGKIQKEIQPELGKIYDSFKNRNGRVKVKKGTPVNGDVVDKYLELARDPKTGKIDPKKAGDMAAEDGYDIDI